MKVSDKVKGGGTGHIKQGAALSGVGVQAGLACKRGHGHDIRG